MIIYYCFGTSTGFDPGAKVNGKQRPLSIPTMKDRAMQALYLFSLDPIAETQGDPNSYGFRPKRGCADAIHQCFIALHKYKGAAQWILDADIKACFDNISHEWLYNNIPIDKRILRLWLNAKIIDGKSFSIPKAVRHKVELFHRHWQTSCLMDWKMF